MSKIIASQQTANTHRCEITDRTNNEKATCFPHLRVLRSGLPVWLFKAKFVIFGLFSIRLAFFIFGKRPNEIWLF